MNKLLIILFVCCMIFATIATVMMLNVAEQNRLIDSKELYGKQKGVEVVMDKADVESTFLKEDFNDKYGVIKLSTADVWTPESQTADYSLIESTAQCLINCEARGKAVLYKDGKLFDDALFYDGKRDSVSVSSKYYIKVLEDYEVQMPDKLVEECAKADAENISKGVEALCSEVQTYRTEIAQREVWQEYSGKDLTAGNYEWKLVANKPIKSEIDFVPVAQGKNLDAWAWWNTTFLKAKTINITGATEQLINFTVYLNVSQTVSSDFQANFNDVRFVDGACNDTQTIELDYEFDKIIGNVSAGVWVRIPTLKSSMALNQNVTQVCMYYNNPTAANGERQTTAWDNYYTIVMHMTNLTSGYYKNSKSGNTTFMAAGGGAATPEFVPGAFGDALNLSTSGANRYAIGGSGATPNLCSTTTFSSEIWSSVYGTAGLGYTRVGLNYLYDKNFVYGAMMNPGYDHTGSSLWSIQVDGTASVISRKWQHTMGNVTWGVAGSMFLFVDKTKYTAPGGGSGGVCNAGTWQLSVRNNDGFGNADFDELRFSNISRSPGWVNRSYDNSNMSFFVFGDATTNAGGGTPVSTSVTLNFPTANYDFTDSDQYLNATITANAGNVTNATLFIWNGTQSLTTYYNGTVTTHPANMSVWNVTLTEGNYTWNVYGCAANATAGACAFAAANLSFNVSTTPIFSNEQIAPASPTTYVEYGNYSFNITMVHAAVDKVLLQFNNTNYTATKIGDIFNVTIRNQAVANYTYIWFANDTFAHKNSTAPKYYNITRATPTLTLATPSWNVNNGTATTVTGSGCPSQLNCSLRRNNTYVSNPDVQTLGAGIYNYTYDTPGNGNFTSATTTNTLTVTNIPDTTAPNVTIYYPTGFIPYVVNGTNQSFNYSIVDDIAPQFCGYIFDTDRLSNKDSFETGFDGWAGSLYSCSGSGCASTVQRESVWASDGNWSVSLFSSLGFGGSTKQISKIFNFNSIVLFDANFTELISNLTIFENNIPILSIKNDSGGVLLSNLSFNVIAGKNYTILSTAEISWRSYIRLDNFRYLNLVIGNLSTTSCTLNSSLNIAGHSSVLLYANDSAGNFNTTTSSWSIGITQNNLTYSQSVIETANASFYINLNINSLYTLTNAYLVYNNTNYQRTFTPGQNVAINSSILIPQVPADNTTLYFYYIFTLNNATGSFNYSSPLYNQTVTKGSSLTAAATCPAGFSPVFNFTFYSEPNRTAQNAERVRYNFLYGLEGNSSTYSLSNNLTNIPGFSLCINNSQAYYDVGYGEIQYNLVGGVERRYYVFSNTRITNQTVVIPLYDLDSSLSTSYLFTSTTTSLIPYVNHYIGLLRWYPEINSYNLVEMGKTDDKGNTVLHVKTEDVDYRFAVYASNGILVKLLNSVRMVCQTTPCTYSIFVDVNPIDLTSFTNIQKSLTWDTATSKFTFIWNDPSQAAQTMNLTVYQETGIGTNILCSSTGTGYTGVLTCDLTGQTGDFEARVVRTASPGVVFAKAVASIKQTFTDVGGGAIGLFFGAILLIFFALIGTVSPVMVVILGIISLIPLFLLGNISWMVLMAIGVLGGVILHFMRRIG
mgnify:CR=1 FL=1